MRSEQAPLTKHLEKLVITHYMQMLVCDKVSYYLLAINLFRKSLATFGISGSIDDCVFDV